MDRVRTVIVDDDIEQAEGIASLINRLRPNWNIQALVHSRTDLVRALEEIVPDVLLLDLHIPQDTPSQQGALDIVAASSVSPVVILITGDPTHALEAYDSNAADYVVKPVRPARLAQALTRAESLLFGVHRNAFPSAASTDRPIVDPSQWLSGVRGRDVFMIDPVDIVYLQAERKYTVAHLADGGNILMRWGITEIDTKLEAAMFLRIHRSTIVNIKRIDFLRRDEMGRLRLFMKERSDGLVVSRGFEHFFKGV